MIDLKINDHIQEISNWVEEDTVERGCLLFVAESKEDMHGAFCALYVNGENLKKNLAAIMLDHPQLYDIMLGACAMARLIWDSDSEAETEKK